MKKKMNVALIAGGTSSERDVSLSGAIAVEKALDRDTFNVRRYDPAVDLGKIIADAAEIDFAFILLHGIGGEDGTMQGFLDLLKIPYQGSGVLGSAVAINKHFSKELYRSAGLPVADWIVVERGKTPDIEALAARFGFPVVVKPVREGSSLGMTIARNAEALAAGIVLGLKHDTAVIVEQYIKGTELTVGVLGNREVEALPVIAILPGEGYEYFDYKAKYQPGASEEICPAPIADTLRDTVQRYALEAHRVLLLRGCSRTDFIVTEAGAVYLLETNTIPGMTETSLLPRAARTAGMSFAQLLERLIALGLEE
ncbi:D-alanine--D-alanine ligase [Desulforhopalus vacuolatus]|uniref:D-alanine--D-alanine ligase family protein n=1 Tax=Desulforhopalus vacuolatus TaxID=40414 RepID=UPI0019631904|nr:D-alanine--D-alanine ligase [Desulforhopalus vacuolatus]MBM9520453.1 D-alanine--D-alanine ligase [Desulforhopalus vacuolatus]